MSKLLTFEEWNLREAEVIQLGSTSREVNSNSASISLPQSATIDWIKVNPWTDWQGLVKRMQTQLPKGEQMVDQQKVKAIMGDQMFQKTLTAANQQKISEQVSSKGVGFIQMSGWMCYGLEILGVLASVVGAVYKPALVVAGGLFILSGAIHIGVGLYEIWQASQKMQKGWKEDHLASVQSCTQWLTEEKEGGHSIIYELVAGTLAILLGGMAVIHGTHSIHNPTHAMAHLTHATKASGMRQAIMRALKDTAQIVAKEIIANKQLIIQAMKSGAIAETIKFIIYKLSPGVAQSSALAIGVNQDSIKEFTGKAIGATKLIAGQLEQRAKEVIGEIKEWQSGLLSQLVDKNPDAKKSLQSLDQIESMFSQQGIKQAAAAMASS